MFYADGPTIVDDGEDVEVIFRVPRAWLDAPTDGVQFVVRHMPDGKLRVHEQRDRYFVLQNGEPVANDEGPVALLRSLGILKAGLWIPDEEYQAVREQVRAYRAGCEAG
jgi:hypothetical protein